MIRGAFLVCAQTQYKIPKSTWIRVGRVQFYADFVVFIKL